MRVVSTSAFWSGSIDSIPSRWSKMVHLENWPPEMDGSPWLRGPWRVVFFPQILPTAEVHWLPGSSEYAVSPFREFAGVSHPTVWTPQLYKEVRAMAKWRYKGYKRDPKLNTADPILNQGCTCIATCRQIWRKVNSHSKNLIEFPFFGHC